MDTLVNNAGLMLLGPVLGADPEEWDRMIAINVQGLLYTTAPPCRTCCRPPRRAPRRVADIVNISSIAGRVAWNGYGVYNLTKFGVNGFTESLRQEVTHGTRRGRHPQELSGLQDRVGGGLQDGRVGAMPRDDQPHLVALARVIRHVLQYGLQADA